MTTPLIITYNLKKRFVEEGDEPLDLFQGVNLTLCPGESLSIVGRSGEGKSTLLHLLGLLEKPSSGEILFPKWPALSHHAIRRKHLGFVFQNFLLLEDMSVLDNVLLPLKINATSGSYGRHMEEAKHLLRRVGLAHRLDHRASRLSRGEKQRCAIARALIHHPTIILADEPTGNLDYEHATQISELLLALVQESNLAMIVVTHDFDLARQTSTCLTLAGGQLMARTWS